MKTRQDEPLRYLQLARQGVSIERSLAGDDLPRWAQLVDGEWSVRASLDFRCDDSGRPWIQVRYESRSGLLCTRCSEVLNHTFSGQAELCVVRDEASASALGGEREVLIADGDELRLADILEDELLLAVPEQLCAADECEHLQPLSYPAAAGADEAAQEQGRKNPFDVLAGLKQQKR